MKKSLLAMHALMTYRRLTSLRTPASIHSIMYGYVMSKMKPSVLYDDYRYLKLGENHSTQTLYNLIAHRGFDGIFQVSFWILLADIVGLDLLRCELGFFLDGFLVVLCEGEHALDRCLVGMLMFLEFGEFEPVCPVALV